jgi:hypothetical protein
MSGKLSQDVKTETATATVVNNFERLKPWQHSYNSVTEEFCKCKEFYYSYSLFPESDNTFQIQRFCRNCGHRFKKS